MLIKRLTAPQDAATVVVLLLLALKMLVDGPKPNVCVSDGCGDDSSLLETVQDDEDEEVKSDGSSETCIVCGSRCLSVPF